MRSHSLNCLPACALLCVCSECFELLHLVLQRKQLAESMRVLLTCAVGSVAYAMVMGSSLGSQTPLEVPLPSVAQKTALEHTFSIFVHYSICT